jgi:hypothetical protein
MYYGRTKIRLATLGNIRSEMATCYRAAVRGELLWPDFAKAVYGLSLIARLDEGAVFDQRLAEVEARLATMPRANGAAGHVGTRRP